MTPILKPTSIVLLAFCTACGPMNEGGLGAKTVERLGALTGLRSTPAPTAPAIPPEVAVAGPGNVLMVTLVARGAVAAMTRVGENNGVETWRTNKGVTLSFREGLLIASRGLNEDLMGADISGVREAIGAGTGTVQRTHAFLDSEDQIRTAVIDCTITTTGHELIGTTKGEAEVTKVTETCTGPSLVFENSYWLDALGGDIVQSQQALAPSVGYIKVNPL